MSSSDLCIFSCYIFSTFSLSFLIFYISENWDALNLYKGDYKSESSGPNTPHTIQYRYTFCYELVQDLTSLQKNNPGECFTSPPPSEQGCDDSTQCPGGMHCASDGSCVYGLARNQTLCSNGGQPVCDEGLVCTIGCSDAKHEKINKQEDVCPSSRPYYQMVCVKQPEVERCYNGKTCSAGSCYHYKTCQQ